MGPSSRSALSAGITIHRLALDAESALASRGPNAFSSLEALLEGPTADVVVLAGPKAAVTDALLTLRRHPDYWERLLVLAGSADQRGEALADGPAGADPAGIEQRWQHWQQRRQRLGAFSEGGDPFKRLDRWLWLRPEAWVQPVRDATQRGHYSYPLLEALLEDTACDGLALLEQQWRLGHYERGPLLDRLRQCRQCRSSHLNYIDVCSRCRSHEIERQPCLHCFTCGHVDRQQHFRQNGVLRCPNCLTQLRHIGSDYDRPLENHHCQSCEHLFIDAAVEARCLSCGHRQEPDELRIREVRAFRLSESGRMRCRSGGHHSIDSAFPYGKDRRILDRPRFLDLLNWQLSIQRDAKQTSSASAGSTALLALKLIPPGDATEDSSAEQNTTELFDTWFEALIESLPESHRVFRQNHDLLWLLIPAGQASDLSNLHQGLETQLQSLQTRALQPLHWQSKACLLNQAIAPADDAELLQAGMLGAMTEG